MSPRPLSRLLLVGVLAMTLLAGCASGPPTGNALALVTKPADPPESVQVITLEHGCFDRYDLERQLLAEEIAEVRNTSGPSIEGGGSGAGGPDFNQVFDACPTAGPNTLYIRADGFTVQATLTWNVTVTDAGPT